MASSSFQTDLEELQELEKAPFGKLARLMFRFTLHLFPLELRRVTWTRVLLNKLGSFEERASAVVMKVRPSCRAARPYWSRWRAGLARLRILLGPIPVWQEMSFYFSSLPFSKKNRVWWPTTLSASHTKLALHFDLSSLVFERLEREDEGKKSLQSNTVVHDPGCVLSKPRPYLPFQGIML